MLPQEISGLANAFHLRGLVTQQDVVLAVELHEFGVRDADPKLAHLLQRCPVIVAGVAALTKGGLSPTVA